MRREFSVHPLLAGHGDPCCRAGRFARDCAGRPRARTTWRALKTEAVMRLDWTTLAAAGVAMLCWAVIVVGAWVTARALG